MHVYWSEKIFFEKSMEIFEFSRKKNHTNSQNFFSFWDFLKKPPLCPLVLPCWPYPCKVISIIATWCLAGLAEGIVRRLPKYAFSTILIFFLPSHIYKLNEALICCTLQQQPPKLPYINCREKNIQNYFFCTGPTTIYGKQF